MLTPRLSPGSLPFSNDLPAKVQSDSRLFADDTAVDRDAICGLPGSHHSV